MDERADRSEEHTSELQSPCNLVCRLLLETKNKNTIRGKGHANPIQGNPTDIGGNLVIIDDPLKQYDAHSEAVRQRTIEWYCFLMIRRPPRYTLFPYTPLFR